MKLLIVSLMMMFSLASASTLGGHDGGGGQGLVCYNNQGEIESVELLDFYEGKILDGLFVDEFEGSAIEIARERFNKFFFEESYLHLLEYIYTSFHFLPSGVRLNHIDDGNIIYTPERCRIEQIANFQGLSRVFIVKDFWVKMNPTHQAGLIMHEFLWYKERTQGVRHSARVKRNNTRMFSSLFDVETQKPLNKIPHLSCWTNQAPYTYFRITQDYKLHFDILVGELNFIQYSLQKDLSSKEIEMLISILKYPHQEYVEYGDEWRNIARNKDFELVLKNSRNQLVARLEILWDSDKPSLKMNIDHYEYQSYTQKLVDLECY